MTGNFGFLADRWPELAQQGADIEASLGSADCPGRAAAFADAAAREIGADYSVVGRSITAAADPSAAYERCLAEFVD